MLDKIFDPGSFEKNYSFGIEASVRNPSAEPFMILLPPPNITGSLHIGHALCYTLQDILARYKRLRKYDVLFQPGLDHAGIVTQLLVEKQLYERGVEKGTLTRETLLKEIWYWKENSGCTILDQLKVLGISCDFSRLRFTMDEESKKAVTKMFVKLYNEGLIYRGEKMVNWDPLIRSAISDLEVVEKTVSGHLWYIKYPAEDSEGEIVVATTRPETIFGDTAVAVHPNDERYERLIGKKVRVPLTDRLVPIIADKYADPLKGSGAVKITPAHDFNDYEVGKRHNLPIIDIMTPRGELNDNVPEMFKHLDRFEARRQIVDLLDKKGLLRKSEKIEQTLPYGDRSGVVLEPRITYQWFVNAEKLAKPAIRAVKEGKIKFVPKHWENLYFEWMNNIKPWCVSRQIWWGHRIPAWYGPDGQTFVAEDLKSAKEQAIRFYGKNDIELKQDEDVLDTWFSSAMWPFVTLGWPNESPELKRYFSHMVVVTGFDIIFFWVARMIMFGIQTNKKVPFKDVYIHGLVRDERGKKMSKSKGNVIDPLELCKKYGADSVRFTLAMLSSPGRDLKMGDKTVESGRNFLTKLWNVVRFAQINGCFYDRGYCVEDVNHPVARWMVLHIKKMVADVETALEHYRFDETVKIIYQCVWGIFCDWYMEFVKIILQHPTEELVPSESGYNLNYTIIKKDLRDTTAWAILQFVRILYPIAPFIAKKLSGEIGVVEMEWPDFSEIKISPEYEESAKEVDRVKNLISSIRSMKQCLGISVTEKLNVYFEVLNQDRMSELFGYTEIINRMAGVRICDQITGEQNIPIVLDGIVAHLKILGKINVTSERKRLSEEIVSLENIRNEAQKRLENEDFIKKASEKVVQEYRNRVESINARIEQLNYIIKNLEA